MFSAKSYLVKIKPILKKQPKLPTNFCFVIVFKKLIQKKIWKKYYHSNDKQYWKTEGEVSIPTLIHLQITFDAIDCKIVLGKMTYVAFSETVTKWLKASDLLS